MSVFSAAELEFLTAQRLGRLATVNAAGEPHVVPVGFHYNAELDTIDIGGRGMGKSRKFRDAARDGRVAFVVDDVVAPWKPRGIEVRGRAAILHEGGKQIKDFWDPEVIRITPVRVIAWGIETDTYQANARTVR